MGLGTMSVNGAGRRIILSFSVLAFSALALRAGDIEVREYSVRVDGQQAGTSQLTIVHTDDGVLCMRARTKMRVDIAGTNIFRKVYQSRESWQDGRLQQFESHGKLDGRPFAICAQRRGERLRIQADQRSAGECQALGSEPCWRLPPGLARECTLPLIDSQTGHALATHFEYVGTDRVTVGRRTNPCLHFVVVSEDPADAWYDQEGYLVRFEQSSGGHHVALELVRVHQGQP